MIRSTGLARLAFVGLLCVSAISLSTPAQGDPVAVELSPQPLASALREFARQTGVQVAIPADLAEGRISGAVKGRLEPSEALGKLLKGTGLIAYPVNGNTYGIRSESKSNGVQGSYSKPVPNEPLQREESLALISPIQAAPPIQDQSQPLKAASGSVLETSNLSEIIVTSQKRQERLVDVPISIVALTAEDLANRNVVNLDDLPFFVPGLAVESNGAQRRAVIRGISNTGGSNSPLIGLYLDEADVSSGVFSQLDLNTYDLERVEVLRGPQGTLYGEGSAGGTIRFITKDPSLDHFAFASDVEALFTHKGSPSDRLTAALNIPVIDNVLGFRIAGAFDHNGGWIDQPAAGRKDINGGDSTDIRVKGLWTPSDAFSARVLAEIHRNDEGANIGEDSSGNYAQDFGLTTTPRIINNFDVYNLTLNYAPSSIKILSTTTYVTQHQEQDNFGWIYQYPQGFYNDVLQSPVDVDAHAFTQELRVSTSSSTPLQWTVGAFYRDFKYSLFSETYYALKGTPLPEPGPYLSTPTSDATSIFGDLSYQITTSLKVGAGARYFMDKETYVSGYPVTDQSGHFYSTDPRVYAQYKFTEDFNVYANAAKGFRSGGFNALGQPAYAPENVWTYELGAKMLSRDRSIQLSADVFYSDYKNYQIYGILPPPVPPPAGYSPTAIYSNGGDASIKGVEWDLLWHPTEGWTLSTNGEYLTSRFYRLNLESGSSAYDIGDQLDYVPKYTITASAQRNVQVSGKNAFLRLDYSRQGRESYRNRSTGDWYFSESNVINMLNINATLDWSQQLSLSLFGSNVLNDRGFLDPDAIEHVAARSRPRTLGVRFTFRFE